MDCPARREGIQSFEFMLTWVSMYVKNPFAPINRRKGLLVWRWKLNDFVDDFIDKSVFFGDIGFHEIIAIGVFLDAL
jgi:hypothetical protein